MNPRVLENARVGRPTAFESGKQSTPHKFRRGIHWTLAVRIERRETYATPDSAGSEFARKFPASEPMFFPVPCFDPANDTWIYLFSPFLSFPPTKEFRDEISLDEACL